MSGFADLIGASGESLLYEDLYLTAGTTWGVPWVVADGAGVAVDLSSATARCDVRSGPGGNLLATWTNTLTSGLQITLDSSGNVAFCATNTATSAWATAGDYVGVYEIQLTLGGQVVDLVKGKITIRQEITTSG
jgi:hypothetical protein